MNPSTVHTGRHAPRWLSRHLLPILMHATLLAAAGGWATSASADTVYLEPRQFLDEVFGQTPEPQVLWLTPQIQQQVVQVLEHPYRQARVRYWRDHDTVVWILEEIGKEYPITAGFVVKAGKLARARVLIYRESRGGEVQQRGFVRQFEGAGLSSGRLDRKIDGITGATMSVDAMQRMAALALVLTGQLPAP